MTSLKVTRQFL